MVTCGKRTYTHYHDCVQANVSISSNLWLLNSPISRAIKKKSESEKTQNMILCCHLFFYGSWTPIFRLFLSNNQYLQHVVCPEDILDVVCLPFQSTIWDIGWFSNTRRVPIIEETTALKINRFSETYLWKWYRWLDFRVTHTLPSQVHGAIVPSLPFSRAMTISFEWSRHRLLLMRSSWPILRWLCSCSWEMEVRFCQNEKLFYLFCMISRNSLMKTRMFQHAGPA